MYNPDPDSTTDHEEINSPEPDSIQDYQEIMTSTTDLYIRFPDTNGFELWVRIECVQMVGDQQQLQHRQLQHQQEQQYLQLQQQQQQQSLLRCNNRDQQQQQEQRGGGSGAAANMMLQNYNDYLDLSYHHVAQAADYTLLPEHHQSESWYSASFLQQQGPDQNASSSSYTVRSESRKVAESSEWNSHFGTDTNSAAFIHANAENSADKDASSSRNEEFLDSSGREQAVTVNGGPHHLPQQQPCMTAAASASAAAGEQDNGPLPASDIEMENGVHLESNLLEPTSLLNLSQPRQGQLQSASEAQSSSASKDGLRLPGFHQAFGSTEIGRFSQHEEFFEAQPLPPPQDPKAIKLEMCTPPCASFLDNESQSFFETRSDGRMSPDSWSLLFNSPTDILASAGFDNELSFIDYSLLADLNFHNEPNPEEILPDLSKSVVADVKIEREEALTNTSSGSNDDSFDNELISNNLPIDIFGMNTEEFARHDFKINPLEQAHVVVSENDKICVMMESDNGSSANSKK